jgi:hypothetical protein
MSKSRGNVVVPDDYIERWGADTFRTYLMFLGPYQEGGDFRDQGLTGPYGFFSRLWDTVVRDGLGDEPVTGTWSGSSTPPSRKVTEDIAGLSYNTAIAAMMEYLNAVREGGRKANRAEVEPLVVLVAPFAPHIAEELWRRLGHDEPLFGRQTATGQPGPLAGVRPRPRHRRHRRVRGPGERQAARAHGHAPRHQRAGRPGCRPRRRERATTARWQADPQGDLRPRPAAQPGRGIGLGAVGSRAVVGPDPASSGARNRAFCAPVRRRRAPWKRGPGRG